MPYTGPPSDGLVAMAIFGIAGLAGSGKSHVLRATGARGACRIDDFNVDWQGNLRHLREAVGAGTDVVLADIMFCDPVWRQRLEDEAGRPVTWLFFENRPWRCAWNCLRRFVRERPRRPLWWELWWICWLGLRYRPATANPIPVHGAAEPSRWRAIRRRCACRRLPP